MLFKYYLALIHAQRPSIKHSKIYYGQVKHLVDDVFFET